MGEDTSDTIAQLKRRRRRRGGRPHGQPSNVDEAEHILPALGSFLLPHSARSVYSGPPAADSRELQPLRSVRQTLGLELELTELSLRHSAPTSQLARSPRTV
ncbi:hypothetical protein J3458_008986 [Metarhizium acridum]|uniref:uncharacterized protein n=1 Tax=Metarhizium acridum TaxID=92637 RepID=UPI001C6BD066|nr:hypothetical protein J3458_008986 [Metarhizium acridum]